MSIESLTSVTLDLFDQTSVTVIVFALLLKIMFKKKTQKNIAECKFGNYGKNCTGICSVNCLYSSICDRFTGHCNEGCKLGWIGNTCDQRKF